MNLDELKVRNIRVAINQSAIICALHCRRRFLYRYIWGLLPKVEKFAKAPTTGRLFHRLLKAGPEGVEEVRKEVQKSVQELMAVVTAGNDLTGEIYVQASGVQELFDKTLAMAHIFWTRFPRPARLECVAKEQLIEMDYEGLKLKGTIDEIDRNRETGEFWIRDAKTTSDKLSLALAGYQWGIQLRLYRLLVNHWLEAPYPSIDPPLRGMILDISMVPGIKFCNKDANFEMYIERVRKWYADKEAQGEETMMAKGITFIEPLVPEELKSTLREMRVLTSGETDPSLYPRDITCAECQGWKRRCDYFKLCESDEKQWPRIVKEDFDLGVPEH